MSCLEKLNEIRSSSGKPVTTGLGDAVIERFARSDSSLQLAIDEALEQFRSLKTEYPDQIALDENDQIDLILNRFVNFYHDDTVNPYVPLAARGPWIVTSTGAVIHDSGGYGMLGLGHGPDPILGAMARPHVMANIMTPSFSQYRLVHALMGEVGHSLPGGCPFQRFLCLNSGSEAVTVAARISDINAKLLTDPGGRHEGKAIKIMALKGAFHGRTDRPAQFSDSTLQSYNTHLASFRDRDVLLTVPPNDLNALRAVFEQVERDQVFVESMFIEPVMGEGDPGMAITPEFYDLAHQLTRQHGSLLLVDSIQAGLRARGCLSIVDYPGFGNSGAPDMETYSKAMNAGQYPLSVLAMTEATAGLFRKGVYGNTMTTNPRAMDVAGAVLAQVTPELRLNIVERGREFLLKLKAMQDELGGPITKVQGTGLLFSCELSPEYKCYGTGSIEHYLRTRGIGVIHGGKNSLRFTPHFRITSAEVDLMIDGIRDGLVNGPKAG
ncbi:MAG: aminotransferase class III-fold pyridoxal phosphate-dependent enzyme [Acidobacteria bacterium]|uniref:Aminotransferase class III-fold pyridoxal phosphate-dependent enzyme n=1 Tax=Candidatus Polarisedimenticola svalbardensis TaxID=2886004 RepID=A0A8J7CEW4_9BACT|nr:aminotransferase class III-fold pyridoxal phosphate-dependent enzyme [Candidatus Polarisedimenticola svalbardensis]